MALNRWEVDDMRERGAVVLIGLLQPLVCWFLPASGRRRKTASELIRNAVNSENVKDQMHLVERLPVQRRSPYSTDRAPLDGCASRLSRPYLPHLIYQPPELTVAPRAARVRPYWTARERVTRWSRRAVMVAAADFHISLDIRDIHSVLDGVGSR
ncbi:hypothetical protein ADL01_33360 [Streptomyces sp. NRRL WC-3618]|nr:hypothetical protein ADL01_33360 [Streptomyces sp. NRRL WC-3618]